MEEGGLESEWLFVLDFNSPERERSLQSNDCSNGLSASRMLTSLPTRRHLPLIDCVTVSLTTAAPPAPGDSLQIRPGHGAAGRDIDWRRDGSTY